MTDATDDMDHGWIDSHDLTLEETELLEKYELCKDLPITIGTYNNAVIFLTLREIIQLAKLVNEEQ